MANTPICDTVINEQCRKLGINNIGKSTIREIVGLVNCIEKETGEKFVRQATKGWHRCRNKGSQRRRRRNLPDG